MSTKEIFGLRKAGRLDEAYQLCISEFPNFSALTDQWEIRAVGWTLYSLIKREKEAGHTDNVRELHRQFNLLHIEDELLLKYQQENFGWEIYRQIKEAMDKEPINVIAVKKLMTQLLRLKQVDKPSILWSCLLVVAMKLKKKFPNQMAFLPFLRIWDIDNFSDNDWEKDENYEKVDCLATRAIQVVCKEISELQKKSEVINKDDEDFIRTKLLSILPRAAEKSSYKEWFSLYECRMYLLLKDCQKARDFAINLIRKKPNLFWTWALLGEVALSNSNNEEALICYLRAASCRDEELYKKNIRLELARLLIKKGMFAEAKAEITIAQQNSGGKAMPNDIVALSSIPEYCSAPDTDNNALYDKFRQDADELIFYDIPWISAICGEKYDQKRKDGTIKKKINFYTQNANGEWSKFSANQNLFSNMDCHHGDPLEIKGQMEGDKFHLLLVRSVDGNKWKNFNEIKAVVDNVNNAKQCIHCIWNSNTFDGCVIQFRSLKGLQLSIGDVIRIRTAKSATSNGMLNNVLTVRLTQEDYEELKHPYVGEVIYPASGEYLFIKEESTEMRIFVPPSIVKESFKNEAFDTAKGIAIKGNKGWKAISMEKYEL